MYGALPHLIQDLLRPLTKGGDFFQALRQVLFVYQAHVEIEKPPVSLGMVLGLRPVPKMDGCISGTPKGSGTF